MSTRTLLERAEAEFHGGPATDQARLFAAILAVLDSLETRLAKLEARAETGESKPLAHLNCPRCERNFTVDLEESDGDCPRCGSAETLRYA